MSVKVQTDPERALSLVCAAFAAVSGGKVLHQPEPAAAIPIVASPVTVPAAPVARFKYPLANTFALFIRTKRAQFLLPFDLTYTEAVYVVLSIKPGTISELTLCCPVRVVSLKKSAVLLPSGAIVAFASIVSRDFAQ